MPVPPKIGLAAVGYGPPDRSPNASFPLRDKRQAACPPSTTRGEPWRHGDLVAGAGLREKRGGPWAAKWLTRDLAAQGFQCAGPERQHHRRGRRAADHQSSDDDRERLRPATPPPPRPRPRAGHRLGGDPRGRLDQLGAQDLEWVGHRCSSSWARKLASPRDTRLRIDLLRRRQILGDHRVGVTERDVADHRIALPTRRGRERSLQVLAAVLSDRRQLPVVALDPLHTQPRSAGCLHLAAPQRISDQVARDAQQPRDRRPAPRVTRPAFNKRAGERLGDHVKPDLWLTDSTRDRAAPTARRCRS